MMRSIALFFFVSVTTISFSPAEATVKDCQNAVSEMKELVTELKSFEHSNDFATYGFGLGAPRRWLDKAEALRDRTLEDKSYFKNVISYNQGDGAVVPGDILGWGLGKMFCADGKGKCNLEYIAFVEDQLHGMRCGPHE